eukprot:733197-Alexandrium_andersonii.AAC.1
MPLGTRAQKRARVHGAQDTEDRLLGCVHTSAYCGCCSRALRECRCGHGHVCYPSVSVGPLSSVA